MRLIVGVLFVFWLFSSPASAAVDDRILQVAYDRFQVVRICAAVGRVILIQMEPGETLDGEATGLALGDARAWVNVKARGNNIWLKQSAERAETNVAIVTTRRTYLFDLVEAKRGQKPTYAVFFSYPDTVRRAEIANAQAVEFAKSAALASEVEALKKAAVLERARAAIEINTDYAWRGNAAALVPTGAYDDGRFTYLEYDHAGGLPVFFRRLADGSEALVNGAMDRDRKTMVLFDVVESIIARSGEAAIEIINKRYKMPDANPDGSSVPGVTRINK